MATGLIFGGIMLMIYNKQMEILVLALIVVLIGIVGLVLRQMIFQSKSIEVLREQIRNDSTVNLLKADLDNINRSIADNQRQMQDRLNNAAKAYSDLSREVGKFSEIGRNMKELQDFLRSPKLRGNIGEQVMKDLLTQMLPLRSFSLQYGFRSGVKVDAVIRTKNGLIPIDSKFPLENFTKAMKADSGDSGQSLKDFAKDVKVHIRSISKKYILPDEGTVDFDMMYIPSENIYYHILSDTDLQQYGVDQRVFMVSPNSFYYFLQTVLLAMEGEKIEEKAKQIIASISAIATQSGKLGDNLQLTGKHLGNAQRAFESSIKDHDKLAIQIGNSRALLPQNSSED